MSSTRSLTAASASRWFPELDHRGVAYGLLVLGITGMFAELMSTRFVPRMVLYLVTLSAAAVGLVRSRRARQSRDVIAVVHPRR